MQLQRVMSHSVLNGGNGLPKSQILTFKKNKVTGGALKDMILNSGLALKKSNAQSRSTLV